AVVEIARVVDADLAADLRLVAVADHEVLDQQAAREGARGDRFIGKRGIGRRHRGWLARRLVGVVGRAWWIDAGDQAQEHAGTSEALHGAEGYQTDESGCHVPRSRSASRAKSGTPSPAAGLQPATATKPGTVRQSTPPRASRHGSSTLVVPRSTERTSAGSRAASR